MNRLLKSSLALLLSGTLMVSVLAGCVSSSNTDSTVTTSGGTEATSTTGEDSTSGEKITLTLEASQTQKTNAPEILNQQNIDEFEKKYPNIKVELLLLPDTQTTSTLQTKLAAGEPSDIIMYNKVSAENELNTEKNMEDLSGEPWVSRLTNADVFKAPDGKIYGFTMEANIGAQAMIYNKDIFKELNLSVPQSYDELLKVCEAIKAKGITPIYAPFKDVWTFQIWTAGSWGYLAQKVKPGLWNDINSGKVKWSDVPEFKDVLQKGMELYQKGYMQKTLLSDDYNGAPNAFSSKKYAMMVMGDWFITDMMTKDPSLKLGFFPIPAFNGQELSISQGQIGGMFFVPKQAKHVKEAKLFIDFMSQKEQVDRSQSVKSFMPSLKDAAAPKLNEMQQEIVDKYLNTNKVTTEMNAFMKVDLNDLWKYYQDMFSGSKTPDKVLAAWDKKFAELMKAKGQPGF